MIFQIVKELEAKNHFLYIDKCHNSVLNHRNLSINNSKRDIVGTNAYAKFEWSPFIKYLCYRTETKCGRTYVRTTDGRTDGRTDTRAANVKT